METVPHSSAIVREARIAFVALMVALLAVAGASAVRAQAHATEGSSVEGAGSFMLGAALVDLAPLSDRLTAAGYEALESTMVVVGGQGHAIFDSGFVIGGRGGALLAPTSDGPDGFRADLGGGFGMAELGYAFHRSPSMLLLATVGIGGYGLSLTLAEQRSVPFDDVLREPRRSETLSVGGLLGGATLGVDSRVPISSVNRKELGAFFSVGLRIGLLYGPPLSEWTLQNGSEATDGPSVGLIAGFAALVVGFGGTSEEAAVHPRRQEVP